MEEPLIAQESNFVRVEGSESVEEGEGSGSRFSYPRQKLLPSRSEAITSGSKYQRAAALVDLAEDGVGLPEEVLDDPRFENAAKYYFIYCNFELLWSLNLFAMLVLNFLEKPLWCARSVHSCQDRVFYFLGELPYLTNGGSVVYEGITFFILIVHTLFPISYEGFHLYWRNRLNILKVVLLALLLCDIILFNAFSISSLPVEQLPMRIAPYLRVLFLALSIREIRACLITLGGMLGMYLNVLALSLMFLLFSSWLAYVTFEDTQQGIIFFTSYGTTLYEMFLLFTTSNNPDVWIPAYKSSRWSCIFFILYVLLGVYFVTNLILAVVYDSFKAELARQVFEMDSMRLRILQKAFNIIDNFNRQFLDKDQCICLFKEMNRYRSLPKTSMEDFELIFSELDDSGDFKINIDEFADLCNAIASQFEKEPSKSMFENYPTFYHSGSCKMLKDFVISPLFGYIVAFVLVLNFVAVVIETTLDIQNNSGQIFWQRVEFSFGWLYVLEIALKIFSVGFDKYWMEGQNQFDFVVTWVIVLGETATLFIPDGFTLLDNGEWIRYLLIARMLRLIRILMHVPRYRGFISTFFKLIPALMPYLGTIFFVMCIYCSLGLQLFGGLVYSGNPDLEATELYDNDYLLFNFNDYPNGMVTLFNILVLASGQEWMQTYKKLTGTSWSLVYFVSFYLIAIMLLLNLVLAFVLEAFFAEMDLKVADDGEGSSSQRKGRKMIGLARSRKVDALLHQVLSNELKESQSMKP